MVSSSIVIVLVWLNVGEVAGGGDWSFVVTDVFRTIPRGNSNDIYELLDTLANRRRYPLSRRRRRRRRRIHSHTDELPLLRTIQETTTYITE